MTPKLFKAAEVCDMAQVQPYVLRSWEKEFPGIGVEKTPDGPRLYRQSDLDQVLKIKQLVFGEGLTLAGARRRLEGPAAAAVPAAAVAQASPVTTAASTPATRTEQPALFEAPAAAGETRERLAQVKDGLRSILTMLSAEERSPEEFAHAAAHSAANAAAHASVPAGEPRVVRPRKRATA